MTAIIWAVVPPIEVRIVDLLPAIVVTATAIGEWMLWRRHR
jgi:hypothetical protein